MSYDSVALGIAASPGASPRGDQRPRECFYYTLVFAAAPTTHLARQQPRVSFREACKLLRGVTAGGAARETRAVEELRAAWEIKFRSGAPQSQDTVPFSSLQELVRDVVLARFSALSGMTLRSSIESQGGRRLLLSFRPSPELLRATAERLRVRVPASSALELQSRDDGKLWSQAEAQEELYRLFLAGKIAAEDAQVFECEDSGMWSRRIRALQRRTTTPSAVGGSEHTVYLPFRNLVALQYVYRQIDGDGDGDANGSTLSPFRVVDKIRLTKALVDAEFDCDALVERGLLVHHLCAHSHHANDVETSLDVLQARWGALPSPWSLVRGLFRRSDDAADPLVHVSNYFGEQLALDVWLTVYCADFAFTSFHARALQTLIALALLLTVVAAQTSRSREAQALFCLATCGFLGVFVRKWELHEARLASEWAGSTPSGDASVVSPLLQLPRPQFRGQLRRSPVTLHLEPSTSLGRQLALRLASTLVLVLVAVQLGASYAMLVASNRFQELADEASWRLNVALGVVALATKCAAPHLARCSRALSNWENHRLQRDYDTQLTFKFAVLQSVNCFGALWGLAFLRPWRCSVGDCRVSQGVSSHDQAARLLLVLLTLDVALALWDLRTAVWRRLRPDSRASMSMEAKARAQQGLDRSGRGATSPTTALLASSPSATPPVATGIEAELALAPYDGVLFDYAQVVIPLGFVAWFAPLAPLPSCVLAWLVAVLQIRVDSHRLCYDTQRPFPTQEFSLGAWLGYLHVLRLGGVLHTAAFALLGLLRSSGEAEDQQTVERRVVAVGALFALVGWMAYALKDSHDFAEERRLLTSRFRQAALESRYLGHLGTHLAAGAKAALPAGRVFLNGVPRYVVTGNKSEEDTAEELREQWRHQQLQFLELEKRVTELREGGGEAKGVGILHVEVQGVSLLPLASSVHSVVQLCVQSGSDSTSLKASKASKAWEGQVANTSVKKSRSPLWHESFELPVTTIEDMLTLRVCDGSQMVATIQQRRVFGRAQLAVNDVILRTGSSASSAPMASPPSAVLTRSRVLSSSSSSDSDEVQQSAAPSVVEVAMATYELPLELSEALRQSELARHAPPRLALRCGISLHELGALLVQQRRLREKMALLRGQEAQLSTWEA
ncbi:hypothetical protein BBJ28_00022262 [Nothophytophthora sp. Chile5]|nr:hypothetical protein BBJ28_00022262 [Nothophytophthora sp. Chile5]